MITEKIDLETKYKAEFAKLFSRSEPLFLQLERGYAMPKIIEKNAILFIGLNPSYEPSRLGEKDRYSHFYSLDQEAGRYFKKFIEFGTEEHPWTHLDLLAIRETKQNKVRDIETNNLDFIWNNLKLSKKILEASNPKVIVVANTLAKKYMGKDRFKDDSGKEHNIWMGYDFGKIQDDGTFRIVNKDSNLKGIPVFFTGMLTGQRALDLGSFERLKWHVKKVLSDEQRE
jgi:hypothetical protein